MDENMENQTPTPYQQPQPSEPQSAPQPEPTSETTETPQPEGDETSKDAKMWAMACHLGGLAMFLSVPFPFTHVIIPLILWLIKKDDFAFVDEQGKEALNFQITIAIGVLISIPLCMIIIGFLLLAALGIFNLVMIIISSIESSKGNHYRYPFALRLVK